MNQLGLVPLPKYALEYDEQIKPVISALSQHYKNAERFRALRLSLEREFNIKGQKKIIKMLKSDRLSKHDKAPVLGQEKWWYRFIRTHTHTLQQTHLLYLSISISLMSVLWKLRWSDFVIQDGLLIPIMLGTVNLVVHLHFEKHSHTFKDMLLISSLLSLFSTLHPLFHTIRSSLNAHLFVWYP